jgi:hypothetical protein
MKSNMRKRTLPEQYTETGHPPHRLFKGSSKTTCCLHLRRKDLVLNLRAIEGCSYEEAVLLFLSINIVCGHGFFTAALS